MFALENPVSKTGFFCSEPHVLRSCLLFSVVFLSFWLPRRIAFGPLTWIPGALSHSAALLCLSSSGSTLRILFCCVLLAEAADVRMGSGGSPIHHILSRGTAIKKCSRRDPKECRLLTLSNIFLHLHHTVCNKPARRKRERKRKGTRHAGVFSVQGGACNSQAGSKPCSSVQRSLKPQSPATP